MGDWSNFDCSISRNATTGEYTVTCSAYLEVNSSYDRQTFVVTSSTQGEGRAVASRTSSGNASWTGKTGTNFGAISYSGYYYCRYIRYDGAYTNVGGHTFSASLGAATFTVTFDKNGGNNPSQASKTVTYGGTYGTLPTCTRTGYDFAGWFTDPTNGTQVLASTNVSITANQTLYAHWTPYTYSVTYDANGGTGAPSAQTKTYGVTLTLSSTKPSRSSSSLTGYKVTFNANGSSSTAPTAITAARTRSYTFSKWNTKADGTGTNYNSGASYTGNAALALYAQWTSTDSTSAITLPAAMTRTGYTFSAWGTSAGATSGYAAGASYTPPSAITLYAVWTPNSYTVNFNANGGTTPTATKQVTYDSTYGTLPTPTKSGYAFVGWFTTASGGTQITSSTTVSITSAQTLYAHWEPMSILHVKDKNGTIRTITNIQVKYPNGTIRTIIGCWAVDKNGNVRQGI